MNIAQNLFQAQHGYLLSCMRTEYHCPSQYEFRLIEVEINFNQIAARERERKILLIDTISEIDNSLYLMAEVANQILMPSGHIHSLMWREVPRS